MGRAYQNKKESMAKTAGAKTKVYSKYGKELYVEAKNGGYDPEGNLIDNDLDRLYLELDNGEMVIGQYAIFDPLTKGIEFLR